MKIKIGKLYQKLMNIDDDQEYLYIFKCTPIDSIIIRKDLVFKKDWYEKAKYKNGYIEIPDNYIKDGYSDIDVVKNGSAGVNSIVIKLNEK